MALTFNLLNIPPDGLHIQQEVEQTDLSLSPDDGTIIGHLTCSGTLVRPNERSASFQGLISGKMSRECVRCLTVYEDPLALVCEATFHKSGHARFSDNLPGKIGKGPEDFSDDRLSDEEMYTIEGNDINLLPAVREHLILATPIQCVCHEACRGLCQVCGANLNEEVCGCDAPVTASPQDVPHGQLQSENPFRKRSTGSFRKGR